MQASRLLSILLVLQARGRQTARALAEEFEVSVRTIYRDVDELSAAGVPIYGEKGPNGGFELLDGYRTRLTGLDRHEAEALFLAGLPHAAAQLGLGEALAKMRLKLLAALPPAARQDAQRVASRFHLDPVSWFQGPDEQALLPTLASAVWTGQAVRMRYDGWKGPVERSALPLGLVLKAGLWYLVARVDEQVRTYRVANVLTVECLAEASEPAAPFDLAAYWASFCEGYEARLSTGQAVIRARPQALRMLARTSLAMASAVESAGALDVDGWHRLIIPTESTGQAVTQLLPLGDGVEVLEPHELRSAMIAAITSLRALYGDPA